MATSGIRGAGTKLSYADRGGEPSWEAIAELRDVDAPEHEVEDIDFTSNESDFSETPGTDPAEWYNEYKPGFIEPGECSFDLVFTQEQYEELLGLLGVEQQFQIEDSAGNTDTFDGYVKRVGKSLPYKGAVTCTCIIRATGKIVHEAAESEGGGGGGGGGGA